MAGGPPSRACCRVGSRWSVCGRRGATPVLAKYRRSTDLRPFPRRAPTPWSSESPSASRARRWTPSCAIAAFVTRRSSTRTFALPMRWASATCPRRSSSTEPVASSTEETRSTARGWPLSATPSARRANESGDLHHALFEPAPFRDTADAHLLIEQELEHPSDDGFGVGASAIEANDDLEPIFVEVDGLDVAEVA